MMMMIGYVSSKPISFLGVHLMGLSSFSRVPRCSFSHRKLKSLSLHVMPVEVNVML